MTGRGAGDRLGAGARRGDTRLGAGVRLGVARLGAGVILVIPDIAGVIVRLPPQEARVRTFVRAAVLSPHIVPGPATPRHHRLPAHLVPATWGVDVIAALP